MKRYIPVLTIAGSDSSGGAGIQADIKTISALGCYAMSAITAITAQNTSCVTAILSIEPRIVKAQIETVWSDIPPLAVKTGMLHSAEIVGTVADTLKRLSPRNLVIDPVMVATSGSRLLDDNAISIMTERLFPLATLITPNLAEAETLTGTSDTGIQIRRLREFYDGAILIKGGDSSDTTTKTDLLIPAGSTSAIHLSSPAVDTVNTHGTGCTLSAAIATRLACGDTVDMAVRAAREYIIQALLSGKDINIGSGHGPVNHLFNPLKANTL